MERCQIMMNANYDVGNEIIYDTEVLKSNIWDYNDAYISNKKLYYDYRKYCKNCIPLTKCIIKMEQQ